MSRYPERAGCLTKRGQICCPRCREVDAVPSGRCANLGSPLIWVLMLQKVLGEKVLGIDEKKLNAPRLVSPSVKGNKVVPFCNIICYPY
jgi:hypothetical protein